MESLLENPLPRYPESSMRNWWRSFMRSRIKRLATKFDLVAVDAGQLASMGRNLSAADEEVQRRVNGQRFTDLRHRIRDSRQRVRAAVVASSMLTV